MQEEKYRYVKKNRLAETSDFPKLSVPRTYVQRSIFPSAFGNRLRIEVLNSEAGSEAGAYSC
jgi:hypothetical protein